MAFFARLPDACAPRSEIIYFCVCALLEEDQDRTIDYLRGEDYMLGDADFREKIEI
jgi:hypothetical protein